MTRRLFTTGVVAGCGCFAQIPDASQGPPGEAPVPDRLPENSDRMPNGKSRSLALAAEQHKRAVEEADELVKMAEDLRRQISGASKFVVPMGAVRKTEDIEKLARKIRGRLQD